MIVFRSGDYSLDLALFGVDLNEESNMFIDSMIKSYSFPFLQPITPELAQKLGFPSTENITSINSELKGTLTIDDDYYEATMTFGEVEGEFVETSVNYGDEVLPVYDTDLADLPWPVHIVTDSQALASKYLDKTWPEVTHNFPMIFRPDINNENGYDDFELFVNKYDGTDFIQNIEETVNNQPVYRNKNVLSPCPYLLEILSFIYKQEGKKIRGNVITDERLNDILYLPEAYIEKFKGSLFSAFQFDVPDATDTITFDNLGGLNLGVFTERINVGIYKRTFTPDNLGTYALKFNLNLDPVTADYFDLNIYQINPQNGDKTYLYTANSRRNRVSINENLSINVTSDNQFHPIWIELSLTYTNESITANNAFEYSYREGRLNELIGSYSLAQFMPDMTAGEYVNLIKNWLNLEIVFKEEYVHIDFVEEAIEELPYVDHSHLEIKRPKKKYNDNRVFKLIYSDKSKVIVDSSGQIFSDIEKEKKDIIEIKMDVQMAIVEQNFNIGTAVYPEKDTTTFGLYSGLRFGSNVCADTVAGFSGKVDNVYQAFWSKWLNTRTNNITFKDKFMAHQSELLQLRSKIFKYNSRLLPKSIRKRRKLQEYWEVEVESETI